MAEVLPANVLVTLTVLDLATSLPSMCQPSPLDDLKTYHLSEKLSVVRSSALTSWPFMVMTLVRVSTSERILERISSSLGNSTWKAYWVAPSTLEVRVKPACSWALSCELASPSPKSIAAMVPATMYSLSCA